MFLRLYVLHVCHYPLSLPTNENSSAKPQKSSIFWPILAGKHFGNIERCSVKRDLNTLAKSFESCQPAQSAQADMGRNFSLSNFSAWQRTISTHEKVGCWKN